MKFLVMYLVGFAIFITAALIGLNKAGILAKIGTTWTILGVLAALGIAVMAAVGAASRGNINIQK